MKCSECKKNRAVAWILRRLHLCPECAEPFTVVIGYRADGTPVTESSRHLGEPVTTQRPTAPVRQRWANSTYIGPDFTKPSEPVDVAATAGDLVKEVQRRRSESR